MSTTLPPHIIAEGDQIMARAATQLAAFVDRFREHTARHDGETLCPFAETTLTSILRRDLPEIFAAAVAQLAAQQDSEASR